MPMGTRLHWNQKDVKPSSLIEADVLQSMIREVEKTPHGSIVEVGVYRGGSASHLVEFARREGRKVYLYDTFSGIPCKDDIDSHQIGDFSDTGFDLVKRLFPDATVVQGVFPGSAVEMDGVSFAHIDCDQYRSVRESAAYLSTKMIRGGIMWFDDVPCLQGASKAVKELFGDSTELISGKTIVRF